MQTSRRGFMAAAIGAVLFPLGIRPCEPKERVLVVHDGERVTLKDGEHWDKIIVHPGGGLSVASSNVTIGSLALPGGFFEMAGGPWSYESWNVVVSAQ